MRITVELDLTTAAGRAAMRAWLDAHEAEHRVAATDRGVVPDRCSGEGAGDVPASQEPAGKGGSQPPGEKFRPQRRDTMATMAVPRRQPWTPTTEFAAPPDQVRVMDGWGETRGLVVPPPPPIDPPPPPPPPPPARDPAPVDFDELAGRDPKRPWTDMERLRAEELAAEGLKPAAIASALQRDKRQVANYLMNVKNGSTRTRLPKKARPAPTHAGEADAYHRPPVMRAEVVTANRENLAAAQAERDLHEALYAGQG